MPVEVVPGEAATVEVVAEQPMSVTVGVTTVPRSATVGIQSSEPGPMGPEGPPGGSLVTGYWSYVLATTPPPLAGQIRTAPATAPVVGAVYTVYLSGIDRDGFLWTGSGIHVGDTLRLRGSSGAEQVLRITAMVLVTGAVDYLDLTTEVLESTGNIAKNADVRVDLIMQPGNPVMVVTQAEYDAIPVYDPEMVYVVV